MTPTPVILLTFANNHDAYLKLIARERKSIFRSLQDYHDNGTLMVHKEENTTVNDIFHQLNRYNNRVVIFHYGGHAGGTHLLLETPGGDNQPAHAAGLARLLGRQNALRLVFLNGCATRQQVTTLLQAGVKAVIATRVPVGDRMATEFAEQFYDALAGKFSLEDAFYRAAAFIATVYGPQQTPRTYNHRDLHWSDASQPPPGDEIENEITTNTIPWGLYLNENAPNTLAWTLPTTRHNTVTLRGTPPPPPREAVNKRLIGPLFNEVARYSDEAGYIARAHQRSGRQDIRILRRLIIDSFPAPIGEQLRRLYAVDRINVDRLRQLTITYRTALRLLCYTMLSQLWDTRHNHPRLTIPDQYRVPLNSFFALDARSYPTFNYLKLLGAVARILAENNTQCFIRELNALLEKMEEIKTDFQHAHLFMEAMIRELNAETIKTDEITDFCLQAEEHLGTILGKLAFLVKYKIATIKQIELIHPRYQPPRYRHTRVVQDRLTAGLIDETSEHHNFADSNSVIIVENLNDMTRYLSLSPFIIDENALNGHDNTKLFFYAYRDAASGHNRYTFTGDETEELETGNQYPHLDTQMEEFKQSLLGDPQ